MKKSLLFFFLVSSVLVYSQEKRKLINGKILFDKADISDVHIVNKNTNQGTISNVFGWFEIPVSIGDSLQFTHINLKTKQFIITKEVFSKRSLEIELEENTYALEGFTLEKPKSIFYVDPQTICPITVNAKTLNLPYANSTAKKDYSVVKFRSGASVDFGNLINALNGNNKRRKQLEKIVKEDNALSKIRKHFTDDFFITDLQIKKEHINPFLNYCHKKNIISYFNKNENIKVTRILMRESKTFPQKINSDSLLVSK
jgi:hypothetical protein